MPEKITSKNLSYSSSLPPFLARLHAQAGGAAGPDPLLAAQKRSAKKRSSSEEAEDAPLVVDEHGNALDLELDKDGTIKDQDNDEPEEEGKKTADKSAKQDNEARATTGTRKRKVGRAIGDAATDEADKDESMGGNKSKSSGDKEKSAPADKKVKKKAKKIKLSFDEDEG